MYALLYTHRAQWHGLVMLLWVMQACVIAIDKAEYRTLSSIAPDAPGNYKSKIMLALTTLAGLSFSGS